MSLTSGFGVSLPLQDISFRCGYSVWMQGCLASSTKQQVVLYGTLGLVALFMLCVCCCGMNCDSLLVLMKKSGHVDNNYHTKMETFNKNDEVDHIFEEPYSWMPNHKELKSTFEFADTPIGLPSVNQQIMRGRFEAGQFVEEKKVSKCLHTKELSHLFHLDNDSLDLE